MENLLKKNIWILFLIIVISIISFAFKKRKHYLCIVNQFELYVANNEHIVYPSVGDGRGIFILEVYQGAPLFLPYTSLSTHRAEN